MYGVKTNKPCITDNNNMQAFADLLFKAQSTDFDNEVHNDGDDGINQCVEDAESYVNNDKAVGVM